MDVFIWSGIDDETYLHNVDTGIEETVDLKELFAEDMFSEAMQIDYSDAISVASNGMV